jgi:hypothetical protein
MIAEVAVSGEERGQGRAGDDRGRSTGARGRDAGRRRHGLWITIRDGRVEQANFDTYPIMRLKDAPKIEVHLGADRGTKWGRVGEPGTAVVTAALTNAIFTATGKRIRRLAIRGRDLSGAARRIRVLSGGGVRPM